MYLSKTCVDLDSIQALGHLFFFLLGPVKVSRRRLPIKVSVQTKYRRDGYGSSPLWYLDRLTKSFVNPCNDSEGVVSSIILFTDSRDNGHSSRLSTSQSPSTGDSLYTGPPTPSHQRQPILDPLPPWTQGRLVVVLVGEKGDR